MHAQIPGLPYDTVVTFERACLRYFFIAVIKHPTTKSNLERKGSISAYSSQVTLHPPGKSG